MVKQEHLLQMILLAISQAEPFYIQLSLDHLLDQTPGADDPFSSFPDQDIARTDEIHNDAIARALQGHRMDTSLNVDFFETIQTAINSPAIRARICHSFNATAVSDDLLENVIHGDLLQCSPDDLAAIDTAWRNLLGVFNVTYSENAVNQLAGLFLPLVDAGFHVLGGDARFVARPSQQALRAVQPRKSKKTTSARHPFTPYRVVDAFKANVRKRSGSSKSLRK